MSPSRLACSCLAYLWLSVSPAGAQSQWPQFRGKDGCGIGATAPVSWDQKRNVVWAVDVPGRGWSSPIVWDDKIFITTVSSDKPAPTRKGIFIQDAVGKIPAGEHRWSVLCLDWKTGRTLWEQTAHKGPPESAIHLKNSYASETPVTDGKRVYAYFGNVGMFCFDMEGKPLWSTKLGQFKTKLGWGTGASPIVSDGRIYIVNDNEEKSFLAAFDGGTGQELWRAPRDERSNWATPFVWKNELRTEIVASGGRTVRSYDLDGKLLWELKGMSSIVVPTPCAGNGLLFLTSGYLLRRPLYAIRPGAAGDISLKGKETRNRFIAWSRQQAGPYHPSPLVYGDYLYVLYDRGFLNCYDARTGKEIYGKKRIDPGSDKFTASPVAAAGNVYCLSEDGDTFVIAAGPKFKVRAKNSLDDMCLATPALARGSMLLRTISKLYRVGVDKQE